MARRSVPVVQDEDMIDITPEEIEGVAEDKTEINESNKALEDEIRAELGAASDDVSFKISVFRIPDTGKDLVYLFAIPGENINGIRERLMDEYGSGHYSIQVFKTEAGKGSRIFRKYRLKIEMPKKRIEPVPVPAADSALALAVKQIGENQTRLIEQLAARLAIPAPVTPAAPVLDFEKILSLAAVAIPLFKQIMPTPHDPMKTIELAATLADKFSGNNGGDRETTFLDVIRDFTKSPILQQAVEATIAAQASQPQVAVQPPRPQIGASPNATQQPRPVSTPQPPAQPANPQAQNFIAYIGMLVGAAKKDSDPGAYAQVIVDNVEPTILQAIISQPDPVAILSQYHPEVATYRAWFLELIEALTNPDDGLEQPGVSPSIVIPANATGANPSPASPDGDFLGSGGGEGHSQADEGAY